MTEPLDDARGELLAALKQIAALNITPDTGTSVALRMRDIAYNALNALRAAPARGDAEGVEAWIEAQFSGHGVAVRRETDAPIPGEPFMSMDEAKEIVRRALVPPPSEAGRISDLTKLAAECHRAKWQFDLNEDYQPSKSAARGLITKAFSELHRIGDIAMKMRDEARALSPDPGTVAVASAQYRCTCGAEPYCAPNVHAASCPLAISSTHHRTPTE